MNSALPRPTAPIASAPRRPDHQRVDDPHRHPAELRHDDRRREREHRTQLAFGRQDGYSMVGDSVCARRRTGAGPASSSRRRCRCSASRCSRRRCRRRSAARGGRGPRDGACRVRPRSRRSRRRSWRWSRRTLRARPDRRRARAPDARTRSEPRRAARCCSSAGAATSLIRKFDVAARDLRKAAETLPAARCALGLAQYLAGRLRRAREERTASAATPACSATSPTRRAGGTAARPPSPAGPPPTPATDQAARLGDSRRRRHAPKPIAASYLAAIERLLRRGRDDGGRAGAAEADRREEPARLDGAGVYRGRSGLRAVEEDRTRRKK